MDIPLIDFDVLPAIC